MPQDGTGSFTTGKDAVIPLDPFLSTESLKRKYIFDLEFHVDHCLTCPSGACLANCQYMDIGKAKAKEEMIRVRDMADIVLEAMA